MIPGLLAFDLDGTLLTSDKRLSDANRAALADMVACGSRIALASGRLGSSMQPCAELIGTDIAMLALNGAAVFTTAFGNPDPVYSASLPSPYARELISYSQEKPFLLNYYHDGKLFAQPAERTRQWKDLYVKQTGTRYHFVENFDTFYDQEPSKIIFVGDEKELDRQEVFFRKRWGEEIYICRTWNHYLEFLHLDANKGNAIAALAQAFAINIANVVTFGDSENDIPMLKRAGTGIAVSNALESTKAAADYVSPWSNDEDAIAQEWKRIKSLPVGSF